MDYAMCDVLVIGGGGAALRAAIAAYEFSPALKVVLLTKGNLGKSGVTATACSDRMAFHATLPHTNPGGEDSWRFHADDIYQIGGMVSDYKLAVILAKQSAQAFAYLENAGVPFIRENGAAKQFLTDGSRYPRACYTGPKTAIDIENALINKFKETKIEVLENTMAARLLVKEQQVYGVLAVDTREKSDVDQAVKVISAKTVIIATGGGGLLFESNVFPGGMTGDGYAMAYWAGASLVNMEFIQMGIASLKTKLNCSGSLLRAIPRIMNEKNEEFLFTALAKGADAKEVSDLVFKKGASWPVTFENKTHIVDVAIYQEILHGHRVFLDYGSNAQGFDWDQLSRENQDMYLREVSLDLGMNARRSSPFMRLKEINQASIDWLKEKNIFLEQGDRIEVGICAQHFQGGVKIGPMADTAVRGLYAVGESAGGQHGANRPGGNALLDGQVFGRIAGTEAAREALAKQNIAPQKETIEAFKQHIAGMCHKGKTSAEEFRKTIQGLMNRTAGVVRTEAGLQKGLDQIKSLKDDGQVMDMHGIAYALENESLLLVAEMVLRAAHLREESRGPHLRFFASGQNIPLPKNNDVWAQYIVIREKDGRMCLEKKQPISCSA